MIHLNSIECKALLDLRTRGMIVHRYLQIDSGQIEFLDTVHEYEDILAPLTLDYPVHNRLSLSTEELIA